MADLQGAVALVTGGWRGIGRSVVDRLRAKGARVCFTYLDGIEPLDQITALCAADPMLSALPMDLRDKASIQACLDQVVQRFGGIDILVNNAAVGSATVARFADDPAEQDDLMLQINAGGTLAMCRGFLTRPATKPSRKIINLSSVGGGVTTFPGFSLSDGMSKAAVAHLTRQLAAEQVRTAVDVFAVCPGATNTVMFQQSTLNHLTAPERAQFLSGLPKGRLIEPDEIATIVAFLAGPQSTVLHGAVIDASMGLGVRPGLMSETRH
jgi:NAD(P)-dependent dehydrogenase (short-subunit alcohol dehydrogenase family)